LETPANLYPGLPVLETAQVALASGSPRRRELLARLLPPDRFRVLSADIDESVLPGEASTDYVRRLALTKARVGARLWLASNPAPGPKLVIAADTSVVLDEVIYGKPANPADAARMLAELAGRTHQVKTGFAVHLLGAASEPEQEESAVCTTDVELRSLSEAEINWYVATGEPLDKAGAYAVQGYGGTLVSAIRGDYYNVVGLPLVPLIELLRSLKSEV
jgi:septum formation protein